MKRKGWLIPILVFIFSFSILFFYQKSQSNVSLANTTALPPILWSKSSADIRKVIYTSAGKEISVVHQDDLWTLSSFNNKRADDLYIYDILEYFAKPIFEQVIEIKPSDLSIYGIDLEHSTKISLFDYDNNEFVLIKGNRINESRDYVYAPISDTVYSVQSSYFSKLKTSETDWLNKQLFSINANNISKITFSYKSIEATLSPSNTNGTLSFTSANISDSLASEFVHFIESSKIQQFITDNADSHVLNVYGFSNPALKCSIFLKDGSTHTLTIGKINRDENICYAVVNGNNSIVAIPYFDLSQFDSLYAEFHGDDSVNLG